MPSVSTYLDHRHLKNLDLYSYSSIDKSPISNYVMSHWWTFSASLMPPWIAPNLITLLGFAAIALNVAAVAIWCPNLEGGPAWVYYFCAAGLFFYQTMDNIDGKQARRTQTSSPLGELFDHGIDSLNCALGGLIQACAMGLGHSRLTLFCVLVGCWSMYLSTWEEYHTGTLFLGFFNGPVEGVLIAVSILAWTGAHGTDWWHHPLASLGFPLVPKESILTAVEVMMAFVLLAFCFAHLPHCLVNVYSTLTLSPTPSSRPLSSPWLAPKTTLVGAGLQLLPVVGFSVLAAGWALSPSSVILSGKHMIEFSLLISVLFGQMSTKVILAQLTKGEFPYSPTLLLPFAGGALGVNVFGFSPTTEIRYLHLSLLLSSLSYAATSSRIISAFCDYLGISCLTIPSAAARRAGGDWEESAGGLGGGGGGRRRSGTDEWERGAGGMGVRGHVRRTASISG